MERTDFIESRVDVVKNIYTLYSYAKSDVVEDRKWALQRYRQGKWFVVERFGDTLLFAPLKFVSYKDNTIDKHKSFNVEDRQIFSRFKKTGLYREASDKFLEEQFESFILELGGEKINPKFLIPKTLNIFELTTEGKCYFIPPADIRGCEEDVWKYFLSYNTIAIEGIISDKNYNKHFYHQFDKLISQIKEGDITCCINGDLGLWGIGVILSSYKDDSYKENSQFSNIVKDGKGNLYHHFDVAWLCYSKDGYIPVSDLNIEAPETQWESDKPFSKSDRIPTYISDFLLHKNNINCREDKKTEMNIKYEKYIKLLEANKNLILTGAPGTGKTYIAREIAKAMGAKVGFIQFHPSYDYTDFVEGLRPISSDKNSGNIRFERINGVFKKFCCEVIRTKKNTITPISSFDALEYFINDLKNEGNIVMQGFSTATLVNISLSDHKDDFIYVFGQIAGRVPRVSVLAYLKNEPSGSYDFYTKLIGDYIKEHYLDQLTPNHNYIISKKHVFIIDEINRGEISKIFGELFFSIDPGYRGAKDLRVKTQYQNLITDKSDPFYDGFYVPENVYIIGTMNDIDRSVESMDFAMRRRFAWVEVKANENTGMLDNLKEMKDEVVATMQRLNSVIWDEAANNGIEGLGTAYHIGGAYFSKLAFYLNDDHSNKEEAYGYLWNNHLKGLLFEYLRGTPHAVENLKKLENAYYNIYTDDIEG